MPDYGDYKARTLAHKLGGPDHGGRSQVGAEREKDPLMSRA